MIHVELYNHAATAPRETQLFLSVHTTKKYAVTQHKA